MPTSHTPAVPGATLAHRQAAFLALLPTIESVARLHFRHVRSPDAKLDRLGEAVALGWSWYLRLMQRGRDPAHFPVTFSQLVARSVASGRRLKKQLERVGITGWPVPPPMPQWSRPHRE